LKSASSRAAAVVVLGFAFALFACQSPSPRGSAPSDLAIPRAVITVENVQEAIRIEADLAPNYEVLPKEGEPWFAVERGPSRVLVVAPHATNPTREGKLRFADAGTGSLALMLHRLAQTTVIYTTKASPSDPNYYDDNDFKRTLADLIREVKPALVLDLHGSHFFRPYDVDFGTMGGKSLLADEKYLALLAQAFRQEGLVNLSLDYFAASKNETVTKWVSGLGVPCIQVEITSTRLAPRSGNLDAHRFAQLLQALVRFVREVDADLPKSPDR